MKTPSLLFLGAFAFLILLVVAGFVFLLGGQLVPQIPNLASSPTQPIPLLTSTSTAQLTSPSTITVAPLHTTSQNPMSKLENPEVGYSLFYPSNWQVRDQVAATAFAKSARCESVEVVDFQPPLEAGSGAFILHSFVQICAKPLRDSLTLDEFIRQTYGDALVQFHVAEIDGIHAYLATNENQDTTVFLQTNDYRIQIVSSVVAEPQKRSERLAQVQAILESFSVQT